MMNLSLRLKAEAKILKIIDRRRLEAGDAGLGSAIERVIIGRCLAELEREASNPAGGSCTAEVTFPAARCRSPLDKISEYCGVACRVL